MTEEDHAAAGRAYAVANPGAFRSSQPGQFVADPSHRPDLLYRPVTDFLREFWNGPTLNLWQHAEAAIGPQTLPEIAAERQDFQARSPGTAAFALNGAIDGSYFAFSDLYVAGDTMHYVAKGQAGREIGIGTLLFILLVLLIVYLIRRV